MKNREILFNIHDLVRLDDFYVASVVTIKVTSSGVKYRLSGFGEHEFEESRLQAWTHNDG
jgi:hypothetical protein